jgi:23S rRNA pseudouridine1911/1915/1917 synthase
VNDRKVGPSAARTRINDKSKKLTLLPFEIGVVHVVDDEIVLVNGKSVKAGYSLKLSDEIVIGEIIEKVADAKPQDIPINIVYEDDDIVIVNKEQGMVVHPAVKNYEGTLVNALMHSINNLSTINGVIRPGIVHRLDKDTSGLMVVAKNDIAHVNLSEQISTKSCRRIYWALVDGIVKEDGEIITNFGRDPKNRLKQAVTSQNSKHAVTHWRVLERFGKYTLVEAKLETGRTHQIRVHMSYIKHPLVGDFVYGPSEQPFSVEGQLLHAKILGFVHPRTGEYMEFERPRPEIFEETLNKIRR